MIKPTVEQCGLEPDYWNYYPALDRKLHSAEHIQWDRCMSDATSVPVGGPDPIEAQSNQDFQTDAFDATSGLDLTSLAVIAFIIVTLAAIAIVAYNHVQSKRTAEATNAYDQD